MRSKGRLSAVALLLASSLASASEAPVEARSYLRLSFGGAATPQLVHLGIAFTDVELRHQQLPPLAQFEFTPSGLLASLAGMPVAAASMRLNQAEEGAAGVAWVPMTLGVAGAGALYWIFVEEDEDDKIGGGPAGAPPQASTCPLPAEDPTGLCETVAGAVDEVLGSLPPPPVGVGFAAQAFGLVSVRPYLDYSRWLDSRYGQMGDLLEQ